jgi:outer membrane receptor for ferrienterochelin and colicins
MKYLFLLAILLIHICNKTLAQTNKAVIAGRVATKDGKPVEGASVVLRPSGIGQSTDSEGKYSIQTQEGTYKLVITSVGSDKIERLVHVKAGENSSQTDVILLENIATLQDMVVTGQFEAQSLKNSVYQVRTIDSERIRLRGATNVQTILNTELGMRFSNDLTLGTSDVQLMGMSGQNVKILLDGVPMVDRGGTRESIGQIDINNIERIEIVEGPMSVIYGTDALAGVINLITKKGTDGNNFTVAARVQEETVDTEYKPFSGKGTHNQNIGLTWQNKGVQLAGNLTRNNFGGWQGTLPGRAKAWMPKEQMLYTASLRYRTEKWNVWYRFNGTDESIKFLGDLNATNKAGDVDYNSKRWFHQAQGEYRASEKLSFIGTLSYTDYSRRTLSTQFDSNSGQRTLDINASQDKSIFTTTFFRGTSQYKVSSKVFLLAGIDVSNNSSEGQRILGTPTINEYALFLSPEIKLTQGFKISPGLRFLKNSVYDAPPVIPSINAKLALNKNLDVRFGYARGFRSPALRELYFNFYDASHSIHGNENLKAEYSNSFNAFLVWQAINKSTLRVNSTFGTFYNVFHDLIDTAVDPIDNTQTTYLNISLFKTTGFTWDNKFFYKDLQASLGASYIARYNQFTELSDATQSIPEFMWSPEVNANILYTFSKLGASLNFFYKYTGKRPTYQAVTTAGVISARLAETAGFHTADLTATKSFGKTISLIGGVKNLFNVTNLANSAQDTGGAHVATGSVPMSYGRSYFLGLNFQWSKN